MSTEIAALNIKVETQQTKAASVELDKLTAAGAKTEHQTKKLETATDQMQRSMSQLRGVVSGLASAFAAYKVAEYIKDSALLAARYETLGVSMTRAGANAGYTKGEMDKLEVSLRSQGIAGVEARQTLTKLAASHMDLSKASAMARAAQDLAVVANINSSEAFERLVQGIQTGQTETLRTLGLNVQFDKSYKDLAKTLKVNVDQLTEAEKTQARMNATLDAAKGYAGLYEGAMDTAGKQINSLKRYTDDLAVSFGSAFNESTASIVKDITKSVKELDATVKDPAFQLGVNGIGQLGASTFGALTAGGTAALQVLGNTAARLTGIFIMVDAFMNRHQRDMDAGYAILTSGDPAKALKLAGTQARDRALTYGATPTGQVLGAGALEAEFNIQNAGRSTGPVKREQSQASIDKARTAAASLTVDLAKANDVSDEGAAKVAELQKKYDEYAKTLGRGNPLVRQFGVLLGYAREHLGNTPAEVHKATEEVLKHTRALEGEIDALRAVSGLYGEDYGDQLTMMRARIAAQEQYTEAVKNGVSAQDAMREKTLSLAKAQAEIDARKQQGGKALAVGFSGPAYEAERDRITAEYRLAIDKEFATDRVALEMELNRKLASLESARLKKTENPYDGMKAGLLDYTESVGTASSRMASLWGTSFKSMEDALSNFVGNGEMDVESLFRTIRTEIARTQVVQPLLSGLSSGRLFSGLSGMLSGWFGSKHTGGIVGANDAGTRSVSPLVFAGAPRFHTGGVVGDEVPIIAKRGEGVFTQEQMKALGQSSSAPKISFTVVNRTGQNVKMSMSKVQQTDEGMTATLLLDMVSRNVGGLRTGLQKSLGK